LLFFPCLAGGERLGVTQAGGLLNPFPPLVVGPTVMILQATANSLIAIRSYL
jgi:hypothetical protein